MFDSETDFDSDYWYPVFRNAVSSFKDSYGRIKSALKSKAKSKIGTLAPKAKADLLKALSSTSKRLPEVKDYIESHDIGEDSLHVARFKNGNIDLENSGSLVRLFATSYMERRENKRRMIQKEATERANKVASKTAEKYRNEIAKRDTESAEKMKDVTQFLASDSLMKKALASKIYTKTKPEIVDWISKQDEVTKYGFTGDPNLIANEIYSNGIKEIADKNRMEKNLAANANTIRESLNVIPEELEQRLTEAETNQTAIRNRNHLQKYILPIERPKVVQAYRNGGLNPRLFRGAYNIRMNQ